MANNTRIPKAELTGIYGAVVKRMSTGVPAPDRPLHCGDDQAEDVVRVVPHRHRNGLVRLGAVTDVAVRIGPSRLAPSPEQTSFPGRQDPPHSTDPGRWLAFPHGKGLGAG
jgi:hypothetical protein